MSSPDPIGPTARSAVGTVLDYLRSLLSGSAPPEVMTELAPDEGPHPKHGPVLVSLARAQKTLDGIDKTLVAREHDKLSEVCAVLRQQLGLAAAEYGRAATPKDREVVDKDYEHLALQAANLEIDTEALFQEAMECKAWTARASELSEIQRLNGELKNFGASEEAGFALDLEAITKTADLKDYKTAGNGLDTLAPRVRKVHAEYSARKQWEDLAGDLQDVKIKLGELKTWKEPDEPGFDGALKTLESDATAQRYAQAVEALNALRPKVLARHGQYPDRGTWLGLKSDIDGTEKTIGLLEAEGATEPPKLRYELKFVREHGARGNYAKAISEFASLRREVDSLHMAYTTDPDRKKWAAMDTDYLSVMGKAESLGELAQEKYLPGTLISEIDGELREIGQAEAAGSFGNACRRLSALKPRVDYLYIQLTCVVRHEQEMSKHAQRIEAAQAVPDSPAVANAKSEFNTANLAVDGVSDPADVPLLDGLRKTLLEKADAVLNAYSSSNPDQTTEEWAKVEYARYWATGVLPAVNRALNVKPVTKAIGELQKQLAIEVEQSEISADGNKWQTALMEARTAAVRAGEILSADKNVGRAAKSLHARYGKIEACLRGMKSKVEGLTPPRTVDQDAFLKALGEFDTEHGAPAPDYAKCMQVLVTKLEPALKKVLDSHVETLKQSVAAADTGTKASDFIEQTSDWELRALPAEQQIKLLNKSRETWATPTQDKKVMERRRELQRKVYQNMDMDEQFLEHEAERRKEVIDSVKNDKDFRNARRTWTDPTMTWEARRQVLQKLADQQCKAFGFGPPPKIKLADLGGNESGATNGYFDPNTQCIVLNTNRYSSANDFQKALDLIVHENSHYYQDQLCAGLVDPETIDPRIKTQVELFKANHVRGGYVPPSEEYNVYQVQPLEMHAHFAGPETASGILAYLESEDTTIDLSQIGILA